MRQLKRLPPRESGFDGTAQPIDVVTIGGGWSSRHFLKSPGDASDPFVRGLRHTAPAAATRNSWRSSSRWPGGRPNYPVLRAASGTTSPIMMLFESIRDDTIVTQDIEPEEGEFSRAQLDHYARVLDACAAPGGKTAHLLELSPPGSVLSAVDVDPDRLEVARENLARLGLRASLAAGDAACPDDWWDGIPFDRILLDAPCTATGVIRRHPDIRLLRQRYPQYAEQRLDRRPLIRIEVHSLRGWSARE